MNGEFCDTNVLVYVHDATAGVKRERGRDLVARLVGSGDGIISIQVLQELYVSLIRKLPRPLSAAESRQIVLDLSTWLVFAPNAMDVLDAIDTSTRWQVSFWDAMILTATRKSGASVLWSEDLSDGQSYDGVLVRNPFR